MSRVSTLRAGSAKVRTLAVAIRAAADSQALAVVRIQHRYDRGDRPYWRVLGYTAAPDIQELYLDADMQEAICDLMRGGRPDIAWTTNHDFHLDTGMLRRSPEPDAAGALPVEDGTFGGTDPVFAPRIPGDTDTRHAA